jgi:FkbM family methyltransferase
MAEWIIPSEDDPTIQGVRIGSIESFNDGDVCISKITHELLSKLECPTCIDIGADVGWWTAFCLEYNRNSFVYTFEPNPISYAKLAQTISGERVKLFNWAVSNTDSTLLFYLNGPMTHSREGVSGESVPFSADFPKRNVSENIALNSSSGGASNKHPLVEIPCKSIRYILEKEGQIDILKIDTEGHEPEILFDFQPYWKRIGALIFEYTVMWYERKTAIRLLEQIVDSFPYVYGVSRKYEPTLFGPITPDTYLEFIYYLNSSRLQMDIVASRIPIETLPIAAITA